MNLFTTDTLSLSLYLYTHTHTHTHIYIYIYIYGETVDFGESDKMIKIEEKWINQTLMTGLMVIFRSWLTEELHQTKHFLHFSTFL